MDEDTRSKRIENRAIKRLLARRAAPNLQASTTSLVDSLASERLWISDLQELTEKALSKELVKFTLTGFLPVESFMRFGARLIPKTEKSILLELRYVSMIRS